MVTLWLDAETYKRLKLQAKGKDFGTVVKQLFETRGSKN
jgi:hypothetical protein